MSKRKNIFKCLRNVHRLYILVEKSDEKIQKYDKNCGYLATWLRAPFIKLSNISESLTTLRYWSWIGPAFLTFLRVSCSQNTKTKCNKHSSVIFWQKIAFFKTFFVSKLTKLGNGTLMKVVESLAILISFVRFDWMMGDFWRFSGELKFWSVKSLVYKGVLRKKSL